MQLEVFSKRFVGSVINYFILNDVSTESSCTSSVNVVSWFDQFLDLVLKSPINSTKFEWPLEMSKISFFRLTRNASNSSYIWLGDRPKRPHNLFSCWQKLQKLNIYSSTDLIYNVRVEIHEHRPARHLFLRYQDDYFEPTFNLRYWVTRYQMIMINLGTIGIYKSYQICVVPFKMIYFFIIMCSDTI